MYKQCFLPLLLYLFLLWNVVLECIAVCLISLIAARFIHLYTCHTYSSAHASPLHPLLAHHHVCYVDVYCVIVILFVSLCFLFLLFAWLSLISSIFLLFSIVENVVLFTTFVLSQYTNTIKLMKIHNNVIVQSCIMSSYRFIHRPNKAWFAGPYTIFSCDDSLLTWIFQNNTEEKLHNLLWNEWKCKRLDQGSPNYGPRAKSGPRSHFVRPAKSFC